METKSIASLLFPIFPISPRFLKLVKLMLKSFECVEPTHCMFGVQNWQPKFGERGEGDQIGDQVSKRGGGGMFGFNLNQPLPPDHGVLQFIRLEFRGTGCPRPWSPSPASRSPTTSTRCGSARSPTRLTRSRSATSPRPRWMTSGPSPLSVWVQYGFSVPKMRS